MHLGDMKDILPVSSIPTVFKHKFLVPRLDQEHVSEKWPVKTSTADVAMYS